MTGEQWWTVAALALLAWEVGGCCPINSKCAGPRAPSSLGAPRTGPPPSPDLAVVRTAEGIVALDEQGQRERTLVPHEASWCRVDARGGVLWYRHGEARTLSLLDLRGEGTPVMVLERTPETLIIAHYAEELGRPEPFQPIDGLVLHLSTLPSLEAVVVCDDDLVRGCFANADALAPERAKRLAELREAFEAQPVLAHGALFEVRDRGERYRPPEPKVPSSWPLREGETFVPEWVSPSGTLGLGHGTLMTLDGRVLASGLQGACGFWGGGWEPET